MSRFFFSVLLAAVCSLPVYAAPPLRGDELCDRVNAFLAIEPRANYTAQFLKFWGGAAGDRGAIASFTQKWEKAAGAPLTLTQREMLEFVIVPRMREIAAREYSANVYVSMQKIALRAKEEEYVIGHLMTVAAAPFPHY